MLTSWLLLYIPLNKFNEVTSANALNLGEFSIFNTDCELPIVLRKVESKTIVGVI